MKTLKMYIFIIISNPLTRGQDIRKLKRTSFVFSSAFSLIPNTGSRFQFQAIPTSYQERPTLFLLQSYSSSFLSSFFDNFFLYFLFFWLPLRSSYFLIQSPPKVSCRSTCSYFFRKTEINISITGEKNSITSK